MANPFGDAADAAGLTASDVTNMLTSLGIGDVGTYTVATLPSPSAYTRRTAWVTDLFSDTPTPGGRVVSEGGAWKPIRPLATATSSITSGDITLTPLLHAPTQIVMGAIPVGATRNVIYSTTGAYPGAKFRTIRRATGGLGSVFMLIGTSLPLNGWADHEFDPLTNAWVQTASGGLL